MNWLRQLASRHREYHNLSEELAEHLEQKIEELISEGMSRADAETTARREFGNALLIEEHSCEVWQWTTLEAILRDARYAFRQLRRNPGFTLTVLITLSLAIGTNTAAFSMLNALLIRPLPYAEPQQLASLIRHKGLADQKGHVIAEDDTGQDGETWELVRDNVNAVQAAVYSYGAA